MRIKKIDNQMYVALRIDEAKDVKRMLDDYSFLCSIRCGYGDDCSNVEDFTNQLDEAILKAESK